MLTVGNAIRYKGIVDNKYTEQLAMMQVTYVKRYLETMHNVKTLGVIRPTKSADGAIRVTDTVHIQVPTNGTALNVVRRSGLTFHFYPDRTKWNELLSDLQQAMSEVQS